MATKILYLILTIYLSLVNAAILRYEDAPLNRIARSPHCWSCEQDYGPPPPYFYGDHHHPHFHTQQWSGLSRSADGSQQQVFSGAAATAQGGTPSADETQAFSLASSGAGESGQHQAGQGYKQKFNSVTDQNKHNAANQGSAASSQVSSGNIDSGNQQQLSTWDSKDSWKHLQQGGRDNANSGSQHAIDQGSAASLQTSSGSNGYLDSGNQQQQQQLGTWGSKDSWKNLQGSHDNTNSGNSAASSSAYSQSHNDGYLQQQQFGVGGNSGHGREDSFNSQTQLSNSGSNGQGIDRHQSHSGKNGHYNSAGSSAGFGRGDIGNVNDNQEGSGTQNGGTSSYFQNQRSNEQQTQFGKSGQGNVGLGSATDFGRGTNKGNELQQIQSGGFGHSQSGSGSSSLIGNERQQSSHEGSYQSQTGKGNQFSENQENLQQVQPLNSGSFKEHGGSSSYDEAQSSLSGALSLASQGLQTPPQPQSGCSSCEGKGSLAYSNAKSHSGSAVALSIGGK